MNPLIQMYAVCKSADRLRIVNGSPAVVRVIDLAGMRDALPINSATDPRAPLPGQ